MGLLRVFSTPLRFSLIVWVRRFWTVPQIFCDGLTGVGTIYYVQGSLKMLLMTGDCNGVGMIPTAFRTSWEAL